MDRRSFVVGIVVLLLCFVSACATQPETIAETVIVQITATSVPTVEPTQTEVKPTEEPSKASPTATSEPTPTKEPTATIEPTSTKEPTATEEPETPSSQKNDGFYTVGVEIEPGLWENQGLGGDCYWAVLDQNQETLKNHYGMSGGSVNIPPDAYEVEFEDCGIWLFVPDLGEREPLSGIDEPKEDGIFTVGIEISAGIWESQGVETDCYWGVLDQDQDTMKNHYGHAGGTVNIPGNGYEVIFEDCGIWLNVLSIGEREPLPDIDEPKDNGFYTIGIEMSAGTWESQGTADDCYWARLTDNQDTIDNHYGKAGGSVTIQPADYEFITKDCGEWIKQ
jgi:hypothetical protein